MKLIVGPRVEKQLWSAEAWWKTNRDNKEMFRLEFAHALRTIDAWPEAGSRTNKDGVRRYHLQAVRYYLFYRVNVDSIELLELRHTSRKPWTP